MALKLKITSAVFDKLSDDLKNEYKKEGDEYVLDVTGIEDTDALRRAHERTKEERDELKSEVKTLSTELDTIKSKQTSSDRDVERTEKRYEKKIESLTAEFTTKLSARDKFIQRQAIETAAKDMASKISTVPPLMAKAIAERLTVELTEEGDKLVPQLKVLDTAGQASEMKLEDLSKEFVANKEYAGIIVGNRASGSGTSRQQVPSSGSAGTDGKQPDLASLNTQALVEHIRGVRENNAAS